MARRHTQSPIYSDAAIKAALYAAHGLVTRAAKKLGAHHTTIRKRIADSAELTAAMADAREPMIDAAEDGLRKAVTKQKGWAIAFTLRTIGRTRGYGLDRSVDAVTDDSVRKLIAEIAAGYGGGGEVSQEGGPCPSRPAGG